MRVIYTHVRVRECKHVLAIVCIRYVCIHVYVPILAQWVKSAWRGFGILHVHVW